MDPLTNARPGTPGRLIRALLIGSLCLNVALGGYVTVQWLTAEPRPFTAFTTVRLLERIARQLPAQDSVVLHDVFRSRQAEVNAARAELDHAIELALVELGRPNLDMAKLRAAAEAAREKRNRQVDVLLDGLFEALERMSPEGRQALVARFDRR